MVLVEADVYHNSFVLSWRTILSPNYNMGLACLDFNLLYFVQRFETKVSGNVLSKLPN